MQTTRLLSLFCLITVVLAGCGHTIKPGRPLTSAPFSYLTLTGCRPYPSNIVDCHLDYGTGFARHRLGSVQLVGRSLAAKGDDQVYQVISCWQTSRIVRQLPNYVCRIYGAQSGADAGSVLIKGGTAVRLARILGDREQVQYRWTRDPWSRLSD